MVIVMLEQNNQTIHASQCETNEEQIIHDYPIDGTMHSSGAEVIDGLFT